MKKAVLALCLIAANGTFISCTDDSLAEINDLNDTYAKEEKRKPNNTGTGGANGGEDGEIDPPDEKPGNN